MGSVYDRNGTWWIKYKAASGEWKYDATSASTKGEAKKLLAEVETHIQRQRLGLAPVTRNPEGWTVAQLLQWWLETYSRHSPSHEKNVGTVRVHLLAAKLASKQLEHLTPGDVEELLQSKTGELAPGTINHVRQFLVRAFNKARKAGKWLGDNPAEETDTRKVPEAPVDILRPDEVFPLFEALAPDQRPVFAAAILAGLRKASSAG